MRATTNSADRGKHSPARLKGIYSIAYFLSGAGLVAFTLCGCAATRTSPEVELAGDAIQEQSARVAPDRTTADRTAFFEQGIEYPEFIRTVKRRQAMWLRNSAKGEVPAEFVERVARARGESPSRLHLLAVAEDGCSDSANIIPYLARFVDEIDKLDLRIIDSVVGREIMTAHPTPDGRAATPTIVVLDSNYRELGCLIERPKELQEWALKSKNELSGEVFMEQKFAWYDNDLGRQSMAEIVAVIEGAGGELVNCGNRSK